MLSNITKVLLIILTVSSIGYVFLTHNHNSTVGFQSPEHDQAIPTSFQDFYHEFHTDSLFQLQHVTFPLPGLTSDSSGTLKHTYWTAESWVLHHRPQLSPNHYHHTFQVTPLRITEIIKTKSYDFSMLRTFTKDHDTYYLSYYKEMGPQEIK